MKDIKSIFNNAINNIIVKRMALAVLISVILHTLIFSGFGWELPSFNSRHSVIEAQLMLLPVKLQEMKPNPVKPKIAKNTAKPVPVPSTVSAPEIIPESTLNQSPAVTTDNIESTEIVPLDESSIVVPQDDPVPRPFTYVVTEFDAKRGQDATPAGSAKITYQALPDNRYILRSELQAKGLLALFIKQRTLISEGSITENGLRPDKFQYIVEKDDQKTNTVLFDWVNKTALFQSKKELKVKVDALPEGTQDLLSFMYQSMFVPPLNQTKFYVANAKSIKEYDYEFAGEEIIESKIGKINTIHLHRANEDSDETVDLWLAADYLHLPVKIVQVGKKGVLEMHMTSIKSDASASPEANNTKQK